MRFSYSCARLRSLLEIKENPSAEFGFNFANLTNKLNKFLKTRVVPFMDIF